MNNQAKIRKITGVSLLIILLSVILLFIGTNGTAFAVTVDSDVYSDLLQMTIDGKKFDVADYPADANAETRMLSFIEYGYSFDETARDKFALFAYVYNPKKDVVAASGQNKIQLASAYDKSGNATEYTKYRLQLVSASADGLFLKYRIAESAEIVKRLTNRDARRYDVSGIELTTRGSYNATEYAVAKTLTFSGYMPSFGENQSAENTLKCTEKGMTETVALELNHTYYRTGHSDKGANHFNQINTAYFSIPNKYVNDKTFIKAITAEWWEYKTQFALVTSNQDFYNLAKQYVGTAAGYRNESIPFYLYYNKKTLQSSTSYEFDWGYNANYSIRYGDALFGTTYYYNTKNYPNIIPYVFYSPSVATNTLLDLFYKEPAGKVDASVVSEWIYNYRNNEVKNYFNKNEKENSVVLFRFAVSDYEAYPVCRTGNENEGKEDCYAASQTVFMDFDVIEFDFQKGEEVFTVPVIASPIDIINDYDSPGIGMKKLPGYDLLILIVAIVLTVIFTILLFVLLKELIVKQFNSAFAKIGMSALCLIVAFAVSAAIIFLCASAVYGAVYKVDFNSAAKAFWKYVISRK